MGRPGSPAARRKRPSAAGLGQGQRLDSQRADTDAERVADRQAELRFAGDAEQAGKPRRGRNRRLTPPGTGGHTSALAIAKSSPVAGDTG